jgi:hypothetical protein
MSNFLTPITTRVRNAREGVGLPQGMEISMNADGTGGAVPEKNPSPAKKIGPQGLGVKGNNGYSVGSPAKCWETHKQVGMKTKGGKRVPNCVPK